MKSTMKTVNLRSFPCFRDYETLQKLNLHVQLQNNLMPHGVADATGCSLEQAMAVLLLLANQYVVEPYLLIYHSIHPDAPPILARNMLDGPLSLPFACDLCEKTITSRDELLYDFLFTKTNDVTFVFEDVDAD